MRRLACIIIALALGAACKPADVPPIDIDGGIVEAGTQVATDICSLINGIDDDDAVRSICATVEEIAQIVAFVLTLRTATDAGTARNATCDVIPTTNFCATSAERAKAILFVVRERAMRVSKERVAR